MIALRERAHHRIIERLAVGERPLRIVEAGAAVDVKAEAAEVEQSMHFDERLIGLGGAGGHDDDIGERAGQIAGRAAHPAALVEQLHARLEPRLARGQPVDETKRAGEIDGGLLIAEALGRGLGGFGEIADRLAEIAALLEMQRQHSRDFRGLRAVARLQRLADQAVQHGAAAGGQPLVKHLLIQRMRKDVAAGDGAVRPFGDALGAEHLAVARQLLAGLSIGARSRFMPPATAAAENSAPTALAASSRRWSSGASRSICRSIISRRSRGMPSCETLLPGASRQWPPLSRSRPGRRNNRPATRQTAGGRRCAATPSGQARRELGAPKRRVRYCAISACDSLFRASSAQRPWICSS